jgi:phosphonate transport system substrate-binding protein
MALIAIRRYRRFVTGLLLFCLSVPSLAGTLRLGVFPYFSAEQLVALHYPLKDYLAQTSGLHIRLVSAPDFRTFKRRTAEGRYDLLITAPHLGRMAERQAGYRWLGVTVNRSEAVFVALRDTGIRGLADLQSKRLALPPRLAIIHQMALETLEGAGLKPGRDLAIMPRRTHDQALYAVIRGDADAAAVGRPTWLRYDAPGKERLQVIGRSASIPGFALMAHSRLAPEMRERLRKALHAFAGTREGKAYFSATGLGGVRMIEPADLALLDHYLARIQAAFEGE